MATPIYFAPLPERRFQESLFEWVPGDPYPHFDEQPQNHDMKRNYLRWRVRSPWNPQGLETPRILLRGCGDSLSLVQAAINDPAMFRNFAAMEPTPAEIIPFANRFGRLGLGWIGEPFHEWEYEVRTMRFLIELWDDASSGRRSDWITEHVTSLGDRIVDGDAWRHAKTILPNVQEL